MNSDKYNLNLYFAVLVSITWCLTLQSQSTSKIEEICKKKGDLIKRICTEYKNGSTSCTFLVNGKEIRCPCKILTSDQRTKKKKLKNVPDLIHIKSILGGKINGQLIKLSNYESTFQSLKCQYLPYCIYIKTESNIELFTTSDHLFIDSKNNFIRADNLTINDTLLDITGNKVPIEELIAGQYAGKVYSTIPISSKPVIKGKYLNFKGIVYATDSDRFAYRTKTTLNNYQIPCVDPRGVNRITDPCKIEKTKYSVDLGNGRFYGIYRPPKYSGQLSIKKGYKPNNNYYKLDYFKRYREVTNIIHKFQRLYPDITINLSWCSNTLNGKAIFVNNKPYTTLNGKVARSTAMSEEGLSLFIGHEIGHFNGFISKTQSTYWKTACENEADYWSALIGMRNYWPSDVVLYSIEKGSNQIKNLLKNDKTIKFYYLFGGCSFVKGSSTCERHAAELCRSRIFLSGKNLSNKPVCH